ncbi:hypothetical protein ACFQ08_06175 [Streptosporangium algeriense]|uniref:Uncharacterized protein n=1 Tax=Streptosporangium algeriense TaxID=1682748 RepID=A0ABW3DN21_9ACTN
MYVHATPRDFASTPVHGACPVDAPRVPVTLHLELTQEEAASVLATFAVGLEENDPRINPAQMPSIIGQILTDVMLQTVRNAALETLDTEVAYPEDGAFYAWCRRMAAPAVPPQRTQNNPTPAPALLAGTAVTR